MNDSFASMKAELSAKDPRSLVGAALRIAAEHTDKLAVLYADVGRRFDLDDVRRGGVLCLDTGISEQNMVGVAAGMCHEGMAPVIITYAPFVAGRVFDQIKANAGAMGLPIGMIGSTAGLSKGDLGPLLMCTDDIAMLRTVPGLLIISPADGTEVVRGIVAAVAAKKPFYIRLTGGHTLPPVHEAEYSFEIGKALALRAGSRVLLITSGAVTVQALRAADRLAQEGQPVAVLEMHTLKPLDTETLDKYWDFETFVTVEEHSVYGGLGSAVAEYLAQKGGGPALKCLGMQDCYFDADLYENLLEKAGLSANRLYHTVQALL